MLLSPAPESGPHAMTGGSRWVNDWPRHPPSPVPCNLQEAPVGWRSSGPRSCLSFHGLFGDDLKRQRKIYYYLIFIIYYYYLYFPPIFDPSPNPCLKAGLRGNPGQALSGTQLSLGTFQPSFVNAQACHASTNRKKPKLSLTQVFLSACAVTSSLQLYCLGYVWVPNRTLPTACRVTHQLWAPSAAPAVPTTDLHAAGGHSFCPLAFKYLGSSWARF